MTVDIEDLPKLVCQYRRRENKFVELKTPKILKPYQESGFVYVGRGKDGGANPLQNILAYKVKVSDSGLGGPFFKAHHQSTNWEFTDFNAFYFVHKNDATERPQRSKPLYTKRTHVRTTFFEVPLETLKQIPHQEFANAPFENIEFVPYPKSGIIIKTERDEFRK